MYIRRHKVRKGGRNYVYLRLVEAYRDEAGKVRHRLVATLGREDQLKASGQLEQLAASFARLDPPAAGTRRLVGPLLLVAHYLDRLGLVKLVDSLVPARGRACLTHGEVIAVLAASRLCSPSPLYDIAGWASSAAVAELLGVPGMLLNDDRLGRALEALAPVAETARGELMLAAIGGFPAVADASRLHLDLTAVRFAGAYEDSALVAKGWAADRSIGRQVKELPAFMTAIGALAAALPPGLVIVADSGLGYLENLCAADARNVRFVAPLRADTAWAARVDARAAQILTRPVAGLLTVATRTRAGKPVITWARDDDAIAAAARLDGLYALATNLPDHSQHSPLTAVDVLKIYKDQWTVEQRHRDLKQTLKVRPVFLHNDDRIAALIAVIGIALLIFGLIEAELRNALGPGTPLPGILPEGRAAIPTARAALTAFDGLSATYTPGGLTLDRLTPAQRMILAYLDIPLPWPEKPC